jgi:formylglycine-generating enzyme required for sulfatase activity
LAPLSQTDAIQITQYIEEEPYYSGKFELVERTKVDKILMESQYQQSGRCDVECAVKIGKKLGASKVIIGTVGRLGNSYTIQIKLVDVATGKIERPASIQAESRLEDLPKFLGDLIIKITGPIQQLPTEPEKKIKEEEQKPVAVAGKEIPLKQIKKKKFPWLIVAGLVVAGGVAAFLLMGKKGKDTPPAVNIPKIDWIQISAGSFKMGDNFNEGDSDERPVHTVYLDTYYISKYEVTFEQYDLFCEATGRAKPKDFYNWGRGSRPVIDVSWEDAKAFCDWLKSKTGENVHLPTEAQWEKAARGTDQRRYTWGNGAPTSSLANYYKNVGKTMPVGSYPSGVSPYGVHDMAGNVWEWCQDWYDANYYSSSPGSNPQGPSSGSARVIRGGGWNSVADYIRSAKRDSLSPSGSTIYFGFRLCKE